MRVVQEERYKITDLFGYFGTPTRGAFISEKLTLFTDEGTTNTEIYEQVQYFVPMLLKNSVNPLLFIMHPEEFFNDLKVIYQI